MDLGLKDRVVLVTGSSSGIGKAVAVAFGAEGARVGVTYHANRQGAEETAQTVRDAGGQSLVLHMELGPAGILSNVVMPGALLTERCNRISLLNSWSR